MKIDKQDAIKVLRSSLKDVLSDLGEMRANEPSRELSHEMVAFESCIDDVLELLDKEETK